MSNSLAGSPVIQESVPLGSPSQNEFERFNEFLVKLRDCDDVDQKFQLAGTADFLTYQLGHLQGSMFEDWSEPSKLYREVIDPYSNTTIYMVPFLCARPSLLVESRLVNDKGNPVNVSYKEVTDKTPTTESYPFHPNILNEGHPKHFTISKRDLVKGFRSIRQAVSKNLILPITKATGYKWVYCKSSYRDRVYFLEFTCFQDCEKDMTPSKGDYSNIRRAFANKNCGSAIHVGIHVFSKKYIISYQHKRHLKLVEIVYSLMAQIMTDSLELLHELESVHSAQETPSHDKYEDE